MVQKFVLTSVNGTESDLKYFYRSEKLDIIFIFDSEKAILSLMQAGALTPKTFLFFIPSWFCNSNRLRDFDKIISLVGRESFREFPSQVTFLANSEYELRLAQEIFRSGATARLVNQNWLLDPDTFAMIPGVQKIYDAVVNSRAVAWKRHDLAKDIENKIFITYPASPGTGMSAPVDLNQYNSKGVFTKLFPRDVAKTLHSCYVGLLLSEMEGACFASTEYLLAGLPVVSTHSFGGRDEWYDDYNSIVCPPSAGEVKAATETLKNRIQAGEINPWEIRRRAIKRSLEFRETLLQRFEEIGFLMGVNPPFRRILASAFSQSVDNKLYNFLNTQFTQCRRL